MKEVTLTDALRALGIPEDQVLSSRDAGDKFIIVQGKPAFRKHEILKVQINAQKPLEANIVEITEAEAKPIIEQAIEKGIDGALKAVETKEEAKKAKILPIRKKKKAKKTTKKK